MRSTSLLMLLFFLLIGVAQAQDKNVAVVLKGQIACSECWFEADRKTTVYGTEADLHCAADCKVDGKPTVLAVNYDKDATLYQLEYGKLKKSENGWLDYTAKIVEVTGTVAERKGKRYLKVDEIKVLADNPTTQSAGNVATGAQSPDLVLKDITGASQSLQTSRGKIVVLNFWATWCGPCKAELPEFVKIQNQYAAFGVQVIGASADEVDNRAAVIKFVRENQINFPIWLGANTTNMAGFGLGPALPGTVIIDRAGKIVAQFRGVVTAAQLQQKLDELLAEPVPQTSEVDEPKTEQTAANTKSASVPS